MLLVWLISSQIGSNITRLAMLLEGVVLLAALPFTVPKSRKWYVTVLAFTGFVGWIGFKSVDDIIHTTPAASWARELAPAGEPAPGRRCREEGPRGGGPARSHREASALAPYVNLARGWNRQADMERNPLFYDDTLNSANYHEWLQRWAVHYVVLPKGEPDGDGGERERRLVQRGMPYLRQIWGDANWQLFSVTDPTPLADPPAVVDRAEQGELTIEVKKAGRVLHARSVLPVARARRRQGREREGSAGDAEVQAPCGGYAEDVRQPQRLPPWRPRRTPPATSGPTACRRHLPPGGPVPTPPGNPVPRGTPLT